MWYSNGFCGLSTMNELRPWCSNRPLQCSVLELHVCCFNSCTIRSTNCLRDTEALCTIWSMNCTSGALPAPNAIRCGAACCLSGPRDALGASTTYGGTRRSQLFLSLFAQHVDAILSPEVGRHQLEALSVASSSLKPAGAKSYSLTTISTSTPYLMQSNRQNTSGRQPSATSPALQPTPAPLRSPSPRTSRRPWYS